jgi:uncharacterized NAD(P)/FAD-binding protein YdhS
MAHLLHYAKTHRKPIDIVLFEPNESVGGPVFRETLPDTYLLNHEADNMGAINPYTAEAQTDDFYAWLQQNKHRPLTGARFTGTIADRYKDFDLDDPKIHLPRSLYGVYLEQRYHDMFDVADGTEIGIVHCRAAVDSLDQQGNGWLVVWSRGRASFDTVVICTGLSYPDGESGMLLAQHPEAFLGGKLERTKSVAVLGSSLSAVEAVISLANEGHTNITLYSRSRRLPKVRGRTAAYKSFLTMEKLRADCGIDGLISFKQMIFLLKAEFDRAYKGRKGLYQAQGINWTEILDNSNPLAQLGADIDAAVSGQEIRWRSVLFSFLDLEIALWDRMSLEDKQYVLDHFSSLLLSYLAPMSLQQARLLQRYFEKGTIRLCGIESYERSRNNCWNITQKDGATRRYDYLLDARGPLKDVCGVSLVHYLVDGGLLVCHPLAGVDVDPETFRALAPDGKPHHSLYIVGAPVFGVRPLQTSTLFYAGFCQAAARHIIRSSLARAPEIKSGWR